MAEAEGKTSVAALTSACLSIVIGLLGMFLGLMLGMRLSNKTGEGHSSGTTPKGTEAKQSDMAIESEFCKALEDPEATEFRRQLTGGCPLTPKVGPRNMNPQLQNAELESASCVSLQAKHCSNRVYGLGGYSRSNRVMICMVGLPARGKSYITQMLIRYLHWTGFPVKSFNAGVLRRQEGMAGASANFFRSDDSNANATRERLASICMEEAISWLCEQTSACVAIFDATNTTVKRRKVIMERCRRSQGITPLFVESICDDPRILEANYNLKLGNDDYQSMDPEQARSDFLDRIAAYETRYEKICDDENDGDISYIKLFNVGQKVSMYQCAGYMTSQIGFYLSNIHISPRCIWLTRHGESTDQIKGVLGSVMDELTESGTKYCQALGSFVRSRQNQMKQDGVKEGAEMLALMATAPVHAATLRALTPCEGSQNFHAMSTSLLNELDGGDCNGMSYEQIREDFPDLWAERERNKLNFRYPGAGGESYADVIDRLKPIIIELERQRRSMVVISHLAVQRCLYAYFSGCPIDEMPYLELDMHTVYELRPGPFGTRIEAHKLG